MPVNKKWPVRELIASCKEYTKKTNRIVSFEYLLADGLNASPAHARQLCKLLKGMNCKVNLIPLNPIKEFKYKRPNYKTIQTFQSIMTGSGIKTTVRFSRGNDIDAAVY